MNLGWPGPSFRRPLHIVTSGLHARNSKSGRVAASSRPRLHHRCIGQQAKEKWAELGPKLLAMKDANYVLPFEKRFLIMPVDLEMKPTCPR